MSKIIKLKHSIDAKHVQNIGEQSVSSPIQAILELVKNSYDADAENCSVHFYIDPVFGKAFHVEKIVIKDDGLGMTVDELQNNWMRIGTQSKTRNNHSPLLKRRVSGEKGMGHFAVQKLGNHVKLISNPRKYVGRNHADHIDKTLNLVIDWEKYEPGKLFDEIENDLEIIERKDESHGITLEITNLKYSWSKTDIKSVQRVLGNLLLPQIIQKTLEHPFKISVHAHGFELKGEIESNLEKYAPYKIDAKLRDNKIHYTIFRLDKKSEKLREAPPIKNLVSKRIIDADNPMCGDADFQLLYYREPTLDRGKWIPQKHVLKQRDLEDQLVDNCGIKIFNDDIRVMPYGDPDNDWLDLSTKVISRYGSNIRNNRSIGYVVLTKKKNPGITETTTRQGLIENREFLSLRDSFVLKVIRILGKYIEAEVEKLKEEGKKENPAGKAVVEIGRITEFINELNISKEDKDIQKARMTSVKSLIKKQEEAMEKKVGEITINLEMYRNLATLGTSALAFHHEIVGPLSRIETRQTSLLKKWDQWDDQKKKEYVEKSLDDILTVESLNSYIRSFASLFKGPKGSKRQKQEINIEESLNRLIDGFERIFAQHSINFEVKKGPGTFSGLMMTPASFESIILNIIGNSMKALLKVKRDKKVIVFSCEKTSTDFIMRIYDNGYGIKQEDRENVFDAFWTTFRGPHEQGTGMGMAIAKELVKDEYGGEIKVEKSIFEEEHPNKGETTFIIAIPLESLKGN